MILTLILILILILIPLCVHIHIYIYMYVCISLYTHLYSASPCLQRPQGLPSSWRTGAQKYNIPRCLCMYIRTCTLTYTWTYTHTHTCTYTRIHSYVHAYVHTYALTYVRNMRTCIYECLIQEFPSSMSRHVHAP